MSRPDRSWTAVIAECGLKRAQPVLARICPAPFFRLDLADALAETGMIPDRATPFADLAPRLQTVLGPDYPYVIGALERLPFDQDQLPAAHFWRGQFRDLHGARRPDLPPTGAALWAAFLDVHRGRTTTDAADPDWLKLVGAGTDAFRKLTDLAKAQRALPLTPLDRSLYARFGWNDDGDVPGMTGLLDAAAVLRTRQAWAIVAPLFDAPARAAIQAAAAALTEADRSAALAGVQDDARRYGLPADQIAAALYPPRAVPSLDDLLSEVP